MIVEASLPAEESIALPVGLDSQTDHAGAHGIPVLQMASQPSWQKSSSRQGRYGLVAVPGRRRLALAGFGLALTLFALGVWGYGAIRRETLGPDAIWAQAESEFRAGRIDRVEQTLARLGRLREPTPLDRMLLAQLAVARVQADEALNQLARVPDDHDRVAQARRLAGQIEMRRYRMWGAEEFIREATRHDPGQVQAHRELICIYSSQLRRAEVFRDFLMLSEPTEIAHDPFDSRRN